MTIRVALAVIALASGIATVNAATKGVMKESTFGCPSSLDTWAGNTLWKSKGYDAAWKIAKPKGCLPFTVAEKVHIIYGSDVAKCAVRDGEMGPCIWIPAELVKAD